MGRVSVTDDEVLDWWEMYDEGWSGSQIAERTGRSAMTIRRYLMDLGVWRARQGGPRTRRPAKERQAEAEAESVYEIGIVLRMIREGVLPDTDRAVMDALGRINEYTMKPERMAGAGEGAIGASMPWIGRATHSHPQSDRQRSQDAMRGYGVRDELASAGLIPSNGPRRHQYFN